MDAAFCNSSLGTDRSCFISYIGRGGWEGCGQDDFGKRAAASPPIGAFAAFSAYRRKRIQRRFELGGQVKTPP
jgi:hypothetical protein